MWFFFLYYDFYKSISSESICILFLKVTFCWKKNLYIIFRIETFRRLFQTNKANVINTAIRQKKQTQTIPLTRILTSSDLLLLYLIAFHVLERANARINKIFLSHSCIANRCKLRPYNRLSQIIRRSEWTMSSWFSLDIFCFLCSPHS